MKKTLRLTEGAVLPVLIKLALPIIGASFVQMAYNLADMFWVGSVGAKALSAVGIAGFYLWFSMAFSVLVRVGTEIKVAQSTGAEEDEDAKEFARTGIYLGVLIAIAYALLGFLFRYPLINIFQIERSVSDMAVNYFSIALIGLVFTIINPVLSAIFNSKGYSKQAFWANSIGLITNFTLDPILIKGFLGFPAMGVEGAAIATVLAQALVTVIFFKMIFVDHQLFEKFSFWGKAQFSTKGKDILKLGMPAAIHSAAFTSIAIVIGIMVSEHGYEANAVQKLGTQIESVSWMSAHGISYAMTAFIGQNFGGKQWDRVKAGYKHGLLMAVGLGVFVTFLLYFGSDPIFALFVSEPKVVSMGGTYLRILALSQLFMCIEITSSGVFGGLGDTKTPAIVGITLNFTRIPFAYILVHTSLGLDGIWWAITLNSILKGCVLYVLMRKRIRNVECSL